MVELYLNEYDFNEQFSTIEEAAQGYVEGDEFEVVQVTVRSRLKFKIIDGKPQMTALSFPKMTDKAASKSSQGGYLNLDFTPFFVGLVIVGVVIGIALTLGVPWVWEQAKPFIHAVTA